MATEFYEVRNYKTAESEIYSAFGDALERLKVLGGNALHHLPSAWYLSRVSDGAFWEPMVRGDGQWIVAIGQWGQRTFTTTGDLIRLQRAAERVRR